jgi:hypothetical protein
MECKHSKSEFKFDIVFFDKREVPFVYEISGNTQKKVGTFWEVE